MKKGLKDETKIELMKISNKINTYIIPLVVFGYVYLGLLVPDADGVIKELDFVFVFMVSSVTGAMILVVFVMLTDVFFNEYYYSYTNIAGVNNVQDYIKKYGKKSKVKLIVAVGVTMFMFPIDGSFSLIKIVSSFIIIGTYFGEVHLESRPPYEIIEFEKTLKTNHAFVLTTAILINLVNVLWGLYTQGHIVNIEIEWVIITIVLSYFFIESTMD